MKRLKLFLASLALVLPLSLAAVAVHADPPINDSSPQAAACQGSNGVWDAATMKCSSPTGTKDLFGKNGTFSTITNLLIFIVGAVSVLMVIIGGLRYVLSGGDSAGTKSAKDTIPVSYTH